MDSQQHLTLPQKRLLVQQPSHLHKIKSRSAGKGNDAIWGSKERTLSSWDMSRNVPDSVTCPGWNTKVTYNPMVLVGNWAEERLKKDYTSKQNFLKENVPKNLSDYRDARSEAQQMRIKNETGVSRAYLFNQHDTLYDENQITMYDENYNQRWREKKLPEMRHWNFNHLAWLPEKTDHPLFGPPTQFGLFTTLKERWEKELVDKYNTYNTMYRSKYLAKPTDHLLQKHTFPRQTMNLSYAHHFRKPSILLRSIN